MVQHLTEQTEKLYKMPEFVTGNIWRGNKWVEHRILSVKQFQDRRQNDVLHT
jgi:hypothetical protein